jgi:hypothetical protein
MEVSSMSSIEVEVQMSALESADKLKAARKRNVLMIWEQGTHATSSSRFKYDEVTTRSDEQ